MDAAIFSRPNIDQTHFDQLLVVACAITPSGTRLWSEIEVAPSLHVTDRYNVTCVQFLANVKMPQVQ